MTIIYWLILAVVVIGMVWFLMKRDKKFEETPHETQEPQEQESKESQESEESQKPTDSFGNPNA
jgi:flagellar basal body-associated protein FliL